MDVEGQEVADKGNKRCRYQKPFEHVPKNRGKFEPTATLTTPSSSRKHNGAAPLAIYATQSASDITRRSFVQLLGTTT